MLLSRHEGGAAGLSCGVVRRRAGDGAGLSESEQAELEQLGRALAIWLWMLKGERK